MIFAFVLLSVLICILLFRGIGDHNNIYLLNKEIDNQEEMIEGLEERIENLGTIHDAFIECNNLQKKMLDECKEELDGYKYANEGFLAADKGLQERIKRALAKVETIKRLTNDILEDKYIV